MLLSAKPTHACLPGLPNKNGYNHKNNKSIHLAGDTRQRQHEHLQPLLQTHGFEVSLSDIYTTVSSLPPVTPDNEKTQAKQVLHDQNAHAVQQHHTIIPCEGKFENIQPPNLKTDTYSSNQMQSFIPQDPYTGNSPA